MTDTTVVSGQTVTIETKSGWLSKINWTQIVGPVCSAIAVFTSGKYNIPPEQQLAIVAVIQGIQSVVTWVFKQWFTPTVTPASASRSGLKTVTTD